MPCYIMTLTPRGMAGEEATKTDKAKKNTQTNAFKEFPEHHSDEQEYHHHHHYCHRHQLDCQARYVGMLAMPSPQPLYDKTCHRDCVK